MAIKIGIILPRSSVYPLVGHQFTNGFRSYKKLFELDDLELIISDAGNGDENSVAASANHLLVQDNVNIITGVISNMALPGITTFAKQARMPIIANQLGAKMLDKPIDCSYIAINSLHLWQSCWALGRWAAKNKGKKALMATSFYEGGYNMGYAFHQGFQEGGGEISGHYITPKIIPDNSANLLKQYVKEFKPDFIFATFSGEDSIRFISDYNKLDKKIPLLGSPFLVDEMFVEDYGDEAQGIQSAFTWSPMLNTPGNKEFLKDFKAGANREPDSFAVMGYETARWIANGIRACGEDGFHAKKFMNSIWDTSIEGPRGEISIDKAQGISSSEIYLRELEQGETEPVNIVVEKIGHSGDIDKSYNEQDPIVASGWTNPYLCI